MPTHQLKPTINCIYFICIYFLFCIYLLYCTPICLRIPLPSQQFIQLFWNCRHQSTLLLNKVARISDTQLNVKLKGTRSKYTNIKCAIYQVLSNVDIVSLKLWCEVSAWFRLPSLLRPSSTILRYLTISFIFHLPHFQVKGDLFCFFHARIFC